MAVDTGTSLPQWAINTLIWASLAISGLFIAGYGWFMRKYIIKVDDHEVRLVAIPSIYATIDTVNEVEDKVVEMMNDVEDKIPGLVSRTELVAYMTQLREDHLRMHRENLDQQQATRSDIRAVHDRVDSILGRK